MSVDSFLIKGRYYRQFEDFFLRDSNNKLYILKDTSGIESLIFDFTVTLGDILKFPHFSDTARFEVISKSKIFLENDSLIRMELKAIPPNNYPNPIWIESIGNVGAGYHPIDWLRYYRVSDIGIGSFYFLKEEPIYGECLKKDKLIDVNKKWYTWASNDNGDRKFSVIYQFLNIDTIISGKIYRKMNQPYTFVRYDSNEQRYYILSNKIGEEIMVFNHRARVGDTIFNTKYYVDTVVKTSYGWVENVYRKIYTTSTDTYLSGIGSVGKVMWDKHLISFPEYQAGNLCYSEFNTMLYHYKDFYILNSCEVNSSISEGQYQKISVYPNPSVDFIYIDDESPKSYSIYNLLGKEILRGNFRAKIDIQSLEKGFYKLVIEWKTQIYPIKLVKQ